jgi:putrescine aminotransferase
MYDYGQFQFSSKQEVLDKGTQYWNLDKIASWQSVGIVLVTAKGLTGGLDPISACLVNEQAGGWLEEDGAARMTTSGRSELGCMGVFKVIEKLKRPVVAAKVHVVAKSMETAMQ